MTGAPFGKFRNKAHKKVESPEATRPLRIKTRKFSKISANLPFNAKIELPSLSLQRRYGLSSLAACINWSQAVVDFSDSSLIESVNVLRWDGFGWWSSNVDGSGVARVAQYFGIDISEGAILELSVAVAARSTAYTWQRLGGRVRFLAVIVN